MALVNVVDVAVREQHISVSWRRMSQNALVFYCVPVSEAVYLLMYKMSWLRHGFVYIVFGMDFSV